MSIEKIEANRKVWSVMFDSLNRQGRRRAYPKEAVVIWLKGHAQGVTPPKRVLDVGCGWCQHAGPFVDEGFEFYGVDVTPEALPNPQELAARGWEGKVRTALFEPPHLNFPDGHFSHVISMEALHLNPDPEGLRSMIAEINRVLKPGGRFLATTLRPDYWFVDKGGVDWVGEHTVRVRDDHVEPERRGAYYFIFKNQDQIHEYFSAFSNCWVGQETLVFGEQANKYLSHWIISCKK